MAITKAGYRDLNEYCDFEYKVIAEDLKKPTADNDVNSLARYFRQIGCRLQTVKGMDKVIQRQMIELTFKFTLDNFVEFGEMLIGLSNPYGLLTRADLQNLSVNVGRRNTN